MNLADLVMTPAQIDSIFGTGTAARFQLKTLHAVTRDGMASRVIGQDLYDCPSFVDNDMSVSWRIGWYDEDQRRDPEGYAAREKQYLATNVLPHERPKPERAKRESRADGYRRRRTCPKCGALPGLSCKGPTGKLISDEHVGRYK